MPIEETTRLLASRKCSSAAPLRPFSAKRFVASSVAPWLMTGGFLLRPFLALVSIRLPLVPAERAAGRRLASFSDKATFFRERKFRLPEGCCRTNARVAKDFRRGRWRRPRSQPEKADSSLLLPHEPRPGSSG